MEENLEEKVGFLDKLRFNVKKKARVYLAAGVLGAALAIATPACGSIWVDEPFPPYKPPECCQDLECPSHASQCFEQCAYNIEGNYSCGCACKPPKAEYPDIVYIDCGCRSEEIGKGNTGL